MLIVVYSPGQVTDSKTEVKPTADRFILYLYIEGFLAYALLIHLPGTASVNEYALYPPLAPPL